MCCMYTVYSASGMQEWVIQIPSIPILVSVLFPSVHLKYFRIKFLLLVTQEIQKTTIQAQDSLVHHSYTHSNLSKNKFQGSERVNDKYQRVNEVSIFAYTPLSKPQVR